jgi:hypothetical protein
MSRDRAFNNAVSAIRAVTKTGDATTPNLQLIEQALQETKTAGFTDTEVFDAARGFSSSDLPDHS